MNDHLRAAPVNEPLLFQWLRWRMMCNSLRAMLRRSAARPLIIVLCSLLVWGFLFALSYLGFHEFRYRWRVAIDLKIGGFVLDLLFCMLMVLLTFSTAIILFGSLFAAEETAFLLVGPVAADQIFAYKYQGAVAFSSWAFVMLGTPVLLGYGLVVGAPWYFYALLPLFFLGFVLVPGSVGALACLLVVNLVPRRRKQALWAGALLLVAGLALWGLLNADPLQNLFYDQDALNQVFDELAVLQSPLLPSHWLARGLQTATLREPGTSFYYLALIWSNGLFLYVVAAWTARRLYRRGYDHMASGGSLRRRYGGLWMDRLVSRALAPLHRQTRLLFVKDFRTFRRDPRQWAQILIFFGLSLLYFGNVRRFYPQQASERPFQNGISILNLWAISFLMCAYTGRFIFPMLSLEGRKFWMLGLLPLERQRLLWGKFAFSATGAILIAEILVVFSDIMLEMPALIILLHALTVVVIALGLSGLSVGLGACLPSFRESDPSKIAVGFGGTLNLVTGLLLLCLVIGGVALPAHLLLGKRGGTELNLSLDDWWLGIGVAVGLAAGAAAVVIPLRLGARALRRMEF
jgi:ABC-2 type transport system permease protein